MSADLKPRPHFRIRDENGVSIGASCTQCYSCLNPNPFVPAVLAVKKNKSADLEPRPHFRIRDEYGVSCTQCHSCLNNLHHKVFDDEIYLTEPTVSTMPPSLITIAASVLYNNGQAGLVGYAYQKAKERRIQKQKRPIGFSNVIEEPKKKKAKVCQKLFD